MENLYVLTSSDIELLMDVASRLVEFGNSFSFNCEGGEAKIISKERDEIDFLAYEYVCNCDSSATYKVESF